MCLIENEPSLPNTNKPKFRIRWLIYLLTGSTLLSCTLISSSLSLTIVAMLGDSEKNSSSSSTPSADVNCYLVDWDNIEKDRMLQAISWGSLTTSILGGRIAEKIGPRIVNFISLLLIGILNCIYPLVATQSFTGAYIIRLTQGLGLGLNGPTNYVILSQWAPSSERTWSNALVNCFGFAANALVNPFVGLVVSTTFLGGWPIVFYFLGALNLILAYIWLAIIRDNPEDHPWLCLEERIEITANRDYEKKTSVQLPWFSILTSAPILVFLANGFTHGWFIAVISSQIPSFYKDVLKVNFKQNGIMLSLPWLLNIVIVLISGFSADKLRSTGRLSSTSLRKIYTSVGLILATLCLLLITVAGSDKVTVVALVTLAKGIGGLNIAGAGSNQLDLSPSFAGTISGIQATVTSLAKLSMNEAVVWIVGNSETQSDWYNFFYLTSGISIFGVIVFAIFGSAEIQPWDPCYKEDSLIPHYSLGTDDGPSDFWESYDSAFVT